MPDNGLSEYLKDAEVILEKVGEGMAYFFYGENEGLAIVYRYDGNGYYVLNEAQYVKALEHELNLEDGWEYIKPVFN